VGSNPAYSLSLPERFAAVTHRSGCDRDPTSAFVTEHVERIAYACPDDADVIFLAVHGDGHTWPATKIGWRMGHFTDEIDATAMIWEFFADHPLVGRSTG
jgi:polyhydroxybutyrate depolymerase